METAPSMPKTHGRLKSRQLKVRSMYKILPVVSRRNEVVVLT